MKVNNLFLVFIFLSYSHFVFSKEPINTFKKIEATKEMPLELIYLIEGLQPSIDYKILLPLVQNIDVYAKVLKKTDIHIISKIEIYKSLLQNTEFFKNAVIDSSSTKALKDTFLMSKEKFTKWFLQALLKDCELLLAEPNFKEYLLQKKSGSISTSLLKKIDKKVQLLYRWTSKLRPESSDTEGLLRKELTPLMLEAVTNISKTFFVMAFETLPAEGRLSISEVNKKNLKFFTIKDTEIQKVLPETNTKSTSVEEILAPVLNELPKPTLEDWTKEDKILPKPIDDTDWLQDI